MAFNPFDVFRRNQKTLFAVLTVVVMFMFVLSFGQGDFFSQVPRWLAARQRSGAVLAEVGGERVYASQLEQVRADRILANQYLFVAATRGADGLAKYVQDGLARASAENKPVFENALRARQQLPLLYSPEAQNPALQFFVEQVRQTLLTTFGRLEAILNAKSAKPEDLQLAEAAKQMIAIADLTAGSRTAHYFNNQPNATLRDGMDFFLWRKKADQLGIRLDDKAVIRLANDEFYGKLTNDDWKFAEDALRGKAGFTPDALRRALADEFRVRAAQTAVAGGQAMRPGGQVADAPYDYFRYYREQTNAARYGVVAVPADLFLADVTGQPTEQELRDLFNRARNTEPDPRTPEPGLKEPRRVKLGWLEFTGTEPYYAKKGAEAVAAADAAATAGTPAQTAAAAVAGFALPGLESPLAKQYAAYKQDHRQQVTANWATPTPFQGGKPLDAHALEAVNVAALVAAFAAGGPLTAPAVFTGDAFASDRIAKVESLLPSLIAPVGPGVGSLATVVGSAAGLAAFTEPLPLAAVRGLLVVKAREEAARRAAFDDMQEFGTELAKLGTKPDEARAKVAAFAKERGLKGGESAELRDRFTLGTDPGLKPLADRFDSDNALQAFRGAYIDPLAFTDQFLIEPDPLGGRAKPATALFKPQTYPDAMQLGPTAGQSAFLVWRSADAPAEAARNLDDPTKNLFGQTVRDKAVALWKRIKARELAKKAADEIAGRAKTFGTAGFEIDQKMRDEVAKVAGKPGEPAAKAQAAYFELDRVAPLAATLAFTPGQQEVVPFSVPRSNLLPYPSQAMQDALLANRAKPVGTAVVLPDNPGDRFYVAVVAGQQNKGADEFGLAVYGPAAQFNQLATAVRNGHQRELRQQIRDRALSLVKAEFRYDRESDELNRRADAGGD
jgi:hypothetical protein